MAACFPAEPVARDPGYVSSIEQWRREREARLKADNGWLTVAGLFWLSDGVNSAGSAASSVVKLPRGPAHIGDFIFHAGQTTFQPDAGAGVAIGGKPATATLLRPDVEKGGPDEITCGEFTLFVIRRGDRYGVRLKDRNSEFRRDFTGLHWYPVKESYRVTARFVTYDQPHSIPIPNILGQTENEPSPGYAEFTIGRRQYRLEPVQEGKELFFIFRDQTSGKETYGAGRFLYAEMPNDGAVVLDFNKAYNPPCAFTPYATCPLPPRQNRLAVRMEAGELKYGSHSAASH
jgi:uncharacterized protein (DUF1684 family)